jgi:hypothetical protein
MSGNYESKLPDDRLSRLINEMQRRLKKVAAGLEAGATAEELMIEVVGIRDYSWRLFGHFDAEITSEEPRKQHPFGFGPETAN